MPTRAAEFVTMLQNDPQLQSKLASAATSEDSRKNATDAGCGDVSSAEFKSIMAGQGQSDELSDEQLAGASGAGGIGFSLPGGWGGGISW